MGLQAASVGGAEGNRTSIIAYSDYRLFLRDYYQVKKRLRPQWGFQCWSKSLGLRSKSALAMILSGQRHPGRQLVERLSRYFDFPTEEQEYFSDLVELQKSQDGSGTKVLLLERLAKKRANGKFERLDLDQFTCLAGWQYVAIRELMNVGGFRWDPQWISHQLEGRVSAAEVRHAMKLLERVGLIGRSETGKRESKPVNLATTSDVAVEAIKRFHEQVLQLAHHSLRETPVSEREILGISLAVRQSDLPEAKKFLREMADRFADAFETTPGERIYQLELAFFPLTRKRNETGGQS